MKAGQLIKILQSVNPDRRVLLTLGESDEYRDMCAKAELEEGECLPFLALDKVEIGEEDDDLYIDLILKQDNYNDSSLASAAAEFDKKYPDLKFK